MSRSGYSDGIENWSLIRWRGQVTSATRGKRGQALLKELLAALDAMPDKRIGSGALVDATTCSLCTLGVALQARGIDPESIDRMFDDEFGLAEDPDSGIGATRAAALALDIAEPLAKEIAFENDEGSWVTETPEARWHRMREWVASQISP